MKNLIIAVALLSFIAGCTTYNEPPATRTVNTTYATPVQDSTVTTSTSTYGQM
jgi:hypothetical protein